VTRILAVDTSTVWGGVALLEHGSPGSPAGVVAEFGARMRGSHSEHLLRWIEHALREADWPRSSLDAFVATRGPGSFTGIRVGLGTCRGLALAAERPCHGVDTLAAIAGAHGPAERERVPFLDAGRSQIYIARYAAQGDPPIERGPARLAGRAELVGEARAGALLIPGPGADASDLLAGPSLAPEVRGLAAAAGRIAAAGAHDAERFLPAPLYVRPPDALLGRPRR